MAFAVEPYIFDWIFFDDSSELKNLAVLTNLKNATDVHQRCYISALCPFGSMCVCIYHPAWAVCVAYSDLWAAKALMRDK